MEVDQEGFGQGVGARCGRRDWSRQVLRVYNCNMVRAYVTMVSVLQFEPRSVWGGGKWGPEKADRERLSPAPLLHPCPVDPRCRYAFTSICSGGWGAHECILS